MHFSEFMRVLRKIEDTLVDKDNLHVMCEDSELDEAEVEGVYVFDDHILFCTDTTIHHLRLTPSSKANEAWALRDDEVQVMTRPEPIESTWRKA
jgi:hypothetical protein